MMCRDVPRVALEKQYLGIRYNVFDFRGRAFFEARRGTKLVTFLKVCIKKINPSPDG